MTHESFAGPIRGNEQVAHDDKVHEHSQLDGRFLACRPKCSSSRHVCEQYRETKRRKTPAEGIQKIRLMPVEVLAKDKISFGKAKIGQPFPEAFKDSAWTAWFIWTYEKSTKPDINSLSSTWAWRSRPSTRRAIPRVSGDSGEQPSQSHAETEVWDKLNGDLRAFRHAGEAPAPAPAPAAAAADADGRSNGQLEHGEQESGNPQEWRWPRQRFFNM